MWPFLWLLQRDNLYKRLMRCEFKKVTCEKARLEQVNYFLQQLRHEPDNVQALISLAKIYIELGEDGPAIKCLWDANDFYKDKAIELYRQEYPGEDINEQPVERFGHLEATMIQADLHMRREEFSTAKRKYWEAMQIDWSCDAAHAGLREARKNHCNSGANEKLPPSDEIRAMLFPESREGIRIEAAGRPGRKTESIEIKLTCG